MLNHRKKIVLLFISMTPLLSLPAARIMDVDDFKRAPESLEQSTENPRVDNIDITHIGHDYSGMGHDYSRGANHSVECVANAESVRLKSLGKPVADYFKSEIDLVGGALVSAKKKLVTNRLSDLARGVANRLRFRRNRPPSVPTPTFAERVANGVGNGLLAGAATQAPALVNALGAGAAAQFEPSGNGAVAFNNLIALGNASLAPGGGGRTLASNAVAAVAAQAPALIDAIGAGAAAQFAPDGNGTATLNNMVNRGREMLAPGAPGRALIDTGIATARDIVRPDGQAAQVIGDVGNLIRAQAEPGAPFYEAGQAGARAGAAAVTTLGRNLARDADALLRPGGEGDLALQQGARAAGTAGTAVINQIGNEANVQVANVARSLGNEYKKAAITTAALFAGVITVWYGSKVLWNALERSLTRPKLIIKSSKESLYTKVKNKVFGKKSKLPAMVFSPELEKQLDSVIASTQNISQKIAQGKKNVKHRNLLLWGPPGTGKTMFAEKLALASGMEYVIMSGSSFSKFKKGEGIAAMDELFAWANKSKTGLMIIIDEAESFLGQRKSDEIHDESYQLLTNFLNYTGARSDKFKIVYLTNHPDAIDDAMGRRIDDLIELPLPKAPERSKLLRLYRDKILLDDDENSREFIESVYAYLDDVEVGRIATLTDRLSGGELEGIINTIKTDADITESGLVSKELIDTAVDRAVRKNRDFALKFIKSKIENPDFDSTTKRNLKSSATV